MITRDQIMRVSMESHVIPNTDSAWIYYMSGPDYNIRVSNREPIARIIYSGFRVVPGIPGIIHFGPEYGRFMGEVDPCLPDVYRLELFRILLLGMQRLRISDCWLREMAPFVSVSEGTTSLLEAILRNEKQQGDWNEIKKTEGPKHYPVAKVFRDMRTKK